MKVGQTKVRVLRRDVNENGRESVREIHRGVVVELSSCFARVFNTNAKTEGGDVSQTSAEFFPLMSKNCWIETIGELANPIKISPELT